MGTMQGLSYSLFKRNLMKKTIIVVFLLLGVSSIVHSDYQEEINKLTERVQELAGSDTGLSDSERFEEIVGMTYELHHAQLPRVCHLPGRPAWPGSLDGSVGSCHFATSAGRQRPYWQRWKISIVRS